MIEKRVNNFLCGHRLRDRDAHAHCKHMQQGDLAIQQTAMNTRTKTTATQLAKMSIDPKFVELTADVLKPDVLELFL